MIHGARDNGIHILFSLMTTAALLTRVSGLEGITYDSPTTQQSLSGVTNDSRPTISSIPYSTREHWMREANQALFTLSGPCPFAAFGSVIVNHTSQPSNSPGRLICIGANSNIRTGNPTQHGEIAAINNCSAILTDPLGPYNMSASRALAAFADLTLYTNAESCPMCASAIRWAGFREYVYGSSIEFLVERGWSQIRVSSFEIFERSSGLASITSLVGGILAAETDPLFAWQFDASHQCPEGCERNNAGSSCVDVRGGEA